MRYVDDGREEVVYLPLSRPAAKPIPPRPRKLGGRRLHPLRANLHLLDALLEHRPDLSSRDLAKHLTRKLKVPTSPSLVRAILLERKILP
jgi:hypothetical protein